MIPQSSFQPDYRKMDFPVSMDSGHAPQQWHWHEEFEIIMCVKSSFILGLDFQFYTLKAEELVMIPGRYMHCLLNTEDAELFSIKFSHKLLRNSPEELRVFLSQNNLSLFWQEKDKQYIRKIVREIREEFLARQPGWQSAIAAQLYAFQSYSVRHLPQIVDSPLLGTRRASHKIHEILLYVAAHYKEERFSVRNCARHFNFNSNYFSALFSQSTGVTFQKYLSSLRLREFEHLLLATDDPVTEICGRAGFSSVKTLNRQFRAMWNMTPTEYRRRNREHRPRADAPETGGQSATPGPPSQ